MSRLTRGEIETLIDDLIVAHPIYTPQLRALRDQSLSQEAVRDEVLGAAFSTKELAQEVLRWLKRDIPETVVATLRVILMRYIETGEWKDDIGMMLGEQPTPPLSIQRFVIDRAAVQNEALKAAMKACEQHLYGTGEFQHGVRTCIEAIEALKREPNAAAQVNSIPQQEDKLSESPTRDREPAPAAPDVAEIVRRLDNDDVYLQGFEAGQLVRLGQGWAHPVAVVPDGYVYIAAGAKGVYTHTDKSDWFYTYSLPPAPGASDD